jgi:long-chain acyl-CoA synthetase
MEITRTFDILELLREKYKKDDILAGKENGIWVKYTTDQFIQESDFFSYGLMAMGMKKGDSIASLSNNRAEWNFADMGMSQIGIIHIPIYPTISLEEQTYILNHCEPKLILVSDKALYEKIQAVSKQISSVRDIYTFNAIEGARHWSEISALGKQNATKYQAELQQIKASITPDDVLTHIYTSGTTGFPKGVVLTHRNLISNVISTSKCHHMGYGEKSLSFLPLCHIYERMFNYHRMYKGISTYYAENMGTIIDNLKEVKPDLFTTVPRLLERVYGVILGKGKDLPYLKKQIFFWAVNLGLKYELHHKNGWWYHFRLKIADKLIFSKWREAMGGNVGIIVSGGAALQPRLARIFWAAGIVVLEGYGLTETSPVIAVNDIAKNEIMFGTVGPVLENVEVKIAEDGEILTRGPHVMNGYYKEPGLTKEAIEDGWFHTGDIGTLIDNKYLKITDRKKEMFKLSSGKYVAPQVIENKLKESFFIEQAMVVGENEKFASALISPNFPFLHEWASRHEIKFRDNQELIAMKEVVSRYQQEVNEINLLLAEHENIKRFRLVREEWSPDTGELSPILKLKRRTLYERYEPLLKEIYSVGKTS